MYKVMKCQSSDDLTTWLTSRGNTIHLVSAITFGMTIVCIYEETATNNPPTPTVQTISPALASVIAAVKAGATVTVEPNGTIIETSTSQLTAADITSGNTGSTGD